MDKISEQGVTRVVLILQFCLRLLMWLIKICWAFISWVRFWV